MASSRVPVNLRLEDTSRDVTGPISFHHGTIQCFLRKQRSDLPHRVVKGYAVTISANACMHVRRRVDLPL